MGCTRSPFSGGLQCCAFGTGPVNPDVMPTDSMTKTIPKSRWVLLGLALTVGVVLIAVGLRAESQRKVAEDLRSFHATARYKPSNVTSWIGDWLPHNLIHSVDAVDFRSVEWSMRSYVAVHPNDTDVNEIISLLAKLPRLKKVYVFKENEPNIITRIEQAFPNVAICLIKG